MCIYITRYMLNYDNNNKAIYQGTTLIFYIFPKPLEQTLPKASRRPSYYSPGSSRFPSWGLASNGISGCI